MQPLIYGVLVDAEHVGDFASGQTIPGRHLQEFAVCRAQLVERQKHELDLPGGTRLDAGWFVGLSYGGEPGPQAAPAPPGPVLVPDHPVGDAEQPRSTSLTRGHLVEATPGNGEHIGGCVLSIRSSQPPQAVPEDGIMMRLEQRIKPQSVICPSNLRLF